MVYRKCKNQKVRKKLADKICRFLHSMIGMEFRCMLTGKVNHLALFWYDKKRFMVLAMNTKGATFNALWIEFRTQTKHRWSSILETFGGHLIKNTEPVQKIVTAYVEFMKHYQLTH